MRIRNITLIGNENNCDDMKTQIPKDDFCGQDNILTTKYKNLEMATNNETKFKDKYKNMNKIDSILPMKPKIKITGIMTDMNNKDDIYLQIREQNPWTNSLDFFVSL